MNATVGPYTLGESLGMLPFGELVVATHTARSEALAVLLLDERLAKEVRFRGLLRLENARAGGLRHPAIARTIEIGEANGALYVVVERPGTCRTLAQILDAGGLTIEDALRLVRQLAEGLDAAHARRLVHGAIDPSCVLVGEDGTVKLAGLGILAAAEEARLLDVIVERRRAAFGAPVQQTGTRTADTADSYALGVLAAAMRERANSTAPVSAVRAVLDRQTAADPTSRYPSCVEFATALAEALGTSNAPAPSAQPDVLATPAQPVAPAWSPPGQGTTPSVSPAPVSPAPPPALLPSPTWAAPPPRPEAPPESPPSLPWDVAPVETPSPPPLPWDVAAPATRSLNAASPDTAPASPPTEHPSLDPRPAPTPAAIRPALPQAGEFELWVRDVIDPPRPAATDSGDTPPLLSRPEPAPHADTDTTWTAADIQPTRAMLAVPGRLEQRDPLGVAVRWATRNAPTLDRQLEQAFARPPLKSVPLGIAAAALLAVLLLILNQIVLSTIVVMLVVVLYGIPRLANALTAGERKRREQAMRVTGQVSIQRGSLGFGWDRCELHLPNGVTLSVPPDRYDLLASQGRPVEVERPAVVAGGTQRVTIGYMLPAVSVTYMPLRTLFLDLRDANGAVLARHPQYEGEPGDTLAAAATVPVPQPDPRWHRSSTGQTVQFTMPPEVLAALEAAKQNALMRAGLICGVPLILLLVTFNTAFAGFVVVAVIGLFITQGALLLERLLKLRTATASRALTRVIGPVTLERYSTAKSHRYQIRLDNGAVLTVDSGIYDALADAGQLRLTEERPSSHSKYNAEERLTTVHEIDTATVTYETDGPMLLEIVDAAGQMLYQERALVTAGITIPQPGA